MRFAAKATLLAGMILLPAAIPLSASWGIDRPVRQDLSRKDLARVRAVTEPTRDFTGPEKFEAMQAGGATWTSAGATRTSGAPTITRAGPTWTGGACTGTGARSP